MTQSEAPATQVAQRPVPEWHESRGGDLEGAGARPAPARPELRAADGQKVGRNDPCPCGSGKKYKKCCLLKGA
jgi:preprotein translocase subunit SecA